MGNLSVDKTKGTATRIYSEFRGVDFRGDETSVLRSPDALNMWKDYKYPEGVSTRPALEAVTANGKKINGIYFFRDKMLIHSQNKLSVFDGSTEVTVFEDMADGESNGFVFENSIYIKDGKNYLQFDGEVLKEVTGYVPTTTISRKPMGGGEKLEDVNLLSEYRINTFLADGTSTEYFLDVPNIDGDYTPEVKINGEALGSDSFIVDHGKGSIKFLQAPEAPLTDGEDNVSIKFKRAVSGNADVIKKCTLLQCFDNRVFFSGNPDHPNELWHCSLEDPTYCSDLDYYKDGTDDARIKGLVAGNNALWVFREPSDTNTTVYYHTPTIDEEYGKIYPSAHSSISTGCIGRAVNFNDDIVFFSDRGLEGITGDITTEQVLSHRSSLIDSRLINEAGYKDMILAEWQGYLLVFIGNKVYSADSRARFENEGHAEYEWYYWELEQNITCATVKDGVLYLGTENGIYKLCDSTGDVKSHWVTSKDKFGYSNRLKTTNKRGCVAEAKGDITVWAKLEGTGFEKIGEYENISDYFVSRIKRKKFKDIQLKFSSEKRFCLESVTLECYIAGYIKR